MNKQVNIKDVINWLENIMETPYTIKAANQLKKVRRIQKRDIFDYYIIDAWMANHCSLYNQQWYECMLYDMSNIELIRDIKERFGSRLQFGNTK
jgi:hypothetical protein